MSSSRVIRMCLSLLMVATFVVPGSALAAPQQEESHFDYDYAYNWALSVGFPESFLEGISEEALKEVYDGNIDAEELVVGEESVEILTTDNPVNDVISMYGTIPEDRMELRALPVKHTSAGKIVKVQIYYTAEWLNGYPSIRETDGIAVNWDSNLWYYDTGTFWGKIEQVHNSTPKGEATVLHSSTYLPEDERGGIGWYAPIKHSPLGFNPIVRIGLELRPINVNMPEGKTKISTVHGKYGHTYLIPQVGFSINGPSVELNAAGDTLSLSCKIQHG